jgi:polysaccharide export outer membrane protein
MYWIAKPRIARGTTPRPSARTLARKSFLRAVFLPAGLACCVLAPGFAQAAGSGGPPQYRVHAGDVIEVSVAGLPELRMRGAVQTDGAISLPLLGALNVAGMTPAEMRKNIQRALAQKIYRQHALDGREVLVVIQADEVGAAIVEYRPIYVNGDVAKPGELTFRPEMTARQAIALAGGVDIAALRSQNPAMEAAAVRGEVDSISIELAKAEARLARISAELEGKEDLSGLKLKGPALPPAELTRIRQGEGDILQARLIDYHRERDFLRSSITQLGERTAVMERQQREEEEGARADTEDLKRMIDLLAKGNVASPRVLEARRALLLSQTRALQVTDGLLLIKKQSNDLARQLQHFEDDRKTELLKEQQEAAATASILKIKRDAALDKLNLLSLARSRLSVDDASQIEIQVIRKENEASTRLAVDGDFALDPGDVVEIAVKAH